tara:strand:+ start:38351 stop:39157 length:807 start_codon:yes stop_codon:yes gene_type:complete
MSIDKNKSQPKVSIVMNCFNGEKFLNESLNSIFKQTYKNWELIFWDNLSTDSSKKILKKFNDERVKYFCSSDFLNLYKARNSAIQKCTGKYILFLDTDDTWMSNKIEKQVNFLQNNLNYKIVYANYYVKNEVSNKITIRTNNLLPYGFITKKLLSDYKLGILTVCLEKSLFKKFYFNNNYNVIGDFDFFINISLTEKIGCIQEPLAYYRMHSNNYSSKHAKLHIKELSNWLKNNSFLKTDYNFSLFYQKFYVLKLKVKYFFKQIKFII